MYFRNSEFQPLLIVGVSLRRNLVLAFLTAILSVPSRWSSYEIVLEAYNLIKQIIKTLNHVAFCLSVLKTLLVSFSVTPLPLRLPIYYGHFILATWQNGSCSSATAIHFLVKKKKNSLIRSPVNTA